MAGDQFDAQGEAREALSTAVTSYGAHVLSDPRMLGNLVTDLLPDTPRERSLLVTAAEAGVASELTQHVEQQHLTVDTAIAMVARNLTESRAIDLAASTWVTTEYAQALGYQTRAASVPPPARLDASSTPMTDTVLRPRYSPQAAPLPAPQSPLGAQQPAPAQSPMTPSFPQPQSAQPQSPMAPPFPQPQYAPPQSPLAAPFPQPQSAPPQSPVAPPFPQPAQPPAPTVFSPAPPAAGPAPGPAPWTQPQAPGYPGGVTPPGTGVPPAGFPYGPGPGQYPGYAPAGYPAGTGGGGRRKAAVIAGIAGAVVLLAGGGIGAAVALSGHSPAPKPPPHPAGPAVALRGATHIATFTPPGGGTFSAEFFSPDGTLIAAKGGAGHATSVYLYSATTRKYLTTIKVAAGDQIYPFSITPDDQYMIAGTCTATACNIYEYTLATGKHGAGVSVPLASFAVNDDGTTEANETLNAQFIDVWDLKTGTFTGHFPNPTTAPVVSDSLYVSSDGAELLLSAVNGNAYVLSATTGQTIATIPYTAPADPHNPASQPLPQLSPDGKTVYVPGTRTTPPQIWSVATAANITPKNPQWPATDNGVVYSTDGTIAVTSPAGAPLWDVWNIDLGTHVTRATIPHSNDWEIDGVGPSGNEVLLGSNPDKNNNSTTLYLYSVP